MAKLTDTQIQEICSGGGIVFKGELFIEDGYLWAKALCWLPCEHGTTDLHSIIVRTNKELWGTKLYFSIGVLDCNARLHTIQKTFPISIEAVKPAREWVDQQIADGVATIKQVIAEYRVLSDLLPELDPVIFNIAEI